MESGYGLPVSGGKAMRKQFMGRASDSVGAENTIASVRLTGIPSGVQESAISRQGIYDARRLRSQREVIRDVMLAAANCDTWLTLGELRALTRYGEASISAQLRHLRKTENGGYIVVKRHRDGVAPAHPCADGRGELVWEYRVSHVVVTGSGIDSAPQGSETEFQI